MQVRYMESVEVADGEFGVKCVDQVRVLEPGSWRTYRKPENGGAWVQEGQGSTNLTYIPWVTFYTGRTGPMTAKPPLLELAHLNVKHWQSQSDQDNLLHVARVPLLFVFTDNEEFQLTISSASATRMPKDGNAKYVEHTGAAITAGRDSLNDLVDDMRMAGAKLLQKDKQARRRRHRPTRKRRRSCPRWLVWLVSSLTASPSCSRSWPITAAWVTVATLKCAATSTATSRLKCLCPT